MKKFGEVCVNAGFINHHQLSEALNRQGALRQPLGKVLLTLGYITDEQLAKALSLQLQLDYCRPMERNPDNELVGVLSARQAERFRVVPVRLDGGRLTVATADPLDL
ncbi:MAG: type II secretion system protein GspE, partial [Bacillota bacterium]